MIMIPFLCEQTNSKQTQTHNACNEWTVTRFAHFFTAQNTNPHRGRYTTTSGITIVVVPVAIIMPVEMAVITLVMSLIGQRFGLSRLERGINFFIRRGFTLNFESLSFGGLRHHVNLVRMSDSALVSVKTHSSSSQVP